MIISFPSAPVQPLALKLETLKRESHTEGDTKTSGNLSEVWPATPPSLHLASDHPLPPHLPINNADPDGNLHPPPPARPLPPASPLTPASPPDHPTPTPRNPPLTAAQTLTLTPALPTPTRARRRPKPNCRAFCDRRWDHRRLRHPRLMGSTCLTVAPSSLPTAVYDLILPCPRITRTLFRLRDRSRWAGSCLPADLNWAGWVG